MLIFSTGLLVLSAFNYGFSDQAFASCQAMDSFIRQFGVYHPSTDTWKIQPLFTSLYNSLKAGGQIIGGRAHFAFSLQVVTDRGLLQVCLSVAILATHMGAVCVSSA